MFFDMACGSLIYYIMYIKPLPEVSSSCQAGRSCLRRFDSELTDGSALPSGEATLAFVEWCNVGKKLYHQSDHSSATPSIIAPRRNLIAPIALGPEFPRPQIIAADPVSVVPSLCGELPLFQASSSLLSISSLRQRLTTIEHLTHVQNSPLVTSLMVLYQRRRSTSQLAQYRNLYPQMMSNKRNVITSSRW